MTREQTVLGDCPNCSTTIPNGGLLITYEREGWPAMFAECPDCGRVVHPQ